MPGFVPFMCCLIIVFTMFIDEGNGKWKSKNRERLQEDIVKFKEMAEKIEDEIEDFYDEYSDNWPKDESYVNGEDSLEISKSLQTHIIKNKDNKSNIVNAVGNTTNNTTENDIPPVTDSTFRESGMPKIGPIKEVGTAENANTLSSKWPKFEDILQDMGKKYDWKNDRWIKVKKKDNQSSDDNHLIFHERHKFSYKTVKLSKTKSRRNIVIAVTAVR